MQREQWVDYAGRLARPVLAAASEGCLLAALRPELHPDAGEDRIVTAPLEALGRTLCGISPWLACPDLPADEQAPAGELAEFARRAIVIGCDPGRDAYLGFSSGHMQTLVDAAFLAHALLRGRRVLWDPLDDRARHHVREAMIALRDRKPVFSNWLLFPAMTEAFLHMTGGGADLMRIDFAVRQFDQWYLGDGTYSDGPEYHADYYNSFVIHPMLHDVLRMMHGVDHEWDAMLEREERRLARAAAIQERLIGPDGSFPVLGRSIAYRCGAFSTLAHAALVGILPTGLSPAQVRSALWAAIDRTLSAPGTWREDGFLRIGLAGAQPSLGETYITTGSLYLATLALLPLGLTPSDPFWTGPDTPWTSVQVWQHGEDVPPDTALQ